MTTDLQGLCATRNLQYSSLAQQGAGVPMIVPASGPADSVSPLSFPLQVCFDVGRDAGHAAALLTKPLEQEIERLSLQLKEERSDAETGLGAALEHAREEGRRAAQLEAEIRLNRDLERINSLLRALEVRTSHYTQQVEREVVMLALGIASRILRHESQIDRLLVAGAVRATLDVMRDGGKVTVRVPLADLGVWQAHLGAISFEGKLVSVEGDLNMKVGECLCELTTGKLDLGIEGQLGEIERAFENILGRREMAQSTTVPAIGVHDLVSAGV